MPEPFAANIVHLDGVAVVRLVGELDLGEAEHAQEIATRALAQSDRGPLILDLSDLVFCDSSGMRALVAIKREASRQDRDLILRGLRPGIRRVLELVGLTEQFTIENPTEPIPT
jgi:anti-sigma B factor antagonist